MIERSFVQRHGSAWRTPISEEILRAKNYAILVVQRQRRSSHELLRLFFKNSKVGAVQRYGEAGPATKASVMSATFQLEGQDFYALNGGPQFTFSPANSFFITVNPRPKWMNFGKKLSARGEKGSCAWLRDKFGVSWQIVPTALGKLLAEKDPEESKRVMQAMLTMDKIDIARLQKAYEG